MASTELALAKAENMATKAKDVAAQALLGEEVARSDLATFSG